MAEEEQAERSQADEVKAPNHAGRLVAAANEVDLFRSVILGFGVLEDILEEHINVSLAEPLEGLHNAPFRQKLNLAVGLGIIAVDQRPAFQSLATLRNQLAHADRDPDSVPTGEMQALYQALDPAGQIEATKAPVRTASGWASHAIIAAFVNVEVGAGVARETRRREQAALRRELTVLGSPSPLVRAVLADVDDAVPSGE